MTTVGGVDNRTLKKPTIRADIDPAPVNRYMLRHYMATPWRGPRGTCDLAGAFRHQAQAGGAVRVPRPDYLEALIRANEVILADLNQPCRRPPRGGAASTTGSCLHSKVIR
jgi:hypothetical protein